MKEKHELQAHEHSVLKDHYFKDCSAAEAASFQASADALEYKAEAFEHKASCELWQAVALAVKDRAWIWQTEACSLDTSMERQEAQLAEAHIRERALDIFTNEVGIGVEQGAWLAESRH